MKKVIAIGSAIAIVVILIMSSIQTDNLAETEDSEDIQEADVIMPTKVSRPGCEETDTCYIPSIITIQKGESVIWLNEDSAFHSVTSGFYDAPDGLFDSDHLDPYQLFSFTFDETGIYDYYCTLHPWMVGQVIVN